jgi:hypothetical protein
MTSSSPLLTTETIAAPVPHDFPFPSCSVCRFPIPPWDLAGGEYEQRHASTCTDRATERGGDGDLGAASGDRAGIVDALYTTGYESGVDAAVDNSRADGDPGGGGEDRYVARTSPRGEWGMSAWDRRHGRWVRTGLHTSDACQFANRLNEARVDWTYGDEPRGGGRS